MLTRKQHELLMFIHERIKETGVSPSFDEMKEALDLASKSGIHRLITALRGARLPPPPGPPGPGAGGGQTAAAGHGGRPAQGSRHVQAPGGGRRRPAAGASQPQIAADDSRELPILGRIAAGTPIEAIQHERERLPVPETMLGGRRTLRAGGPGRLDDQGRHPRRRLCGHQARATRPTAARSSWPW